LVIALVVCAMLAELVQSEILIPCKQEVGEARRLLRKNRKSLESLESSSERCMCKSNAVDIMDAFRGRK
jgi:hypothetical protein